MEEIEKVDTAATENAGEGATVTPEAQTGAVAEPKKEEAKVDAVTTENKAEAVIENKVSMTQKEIDEIVEARIARERKKLEKELGDETLKTQLEQLQSENLTLKQEREVGKYKIADEFKDFVQFKVKSMVTAEKDFTTVLKEFMADEKSAKYIADKGDVVAMPRPKNSSGNEADVAAAQKMKAAMGIK